MSKRNDPMPKPAKALTRKKKAKVDKALRKADAGLKAYPIDAQKPSPGSASPPSLLDTVIEMRPYTRREQMIRMLCPRYGVSSATVDRAIAKAVQLTKEKYENNRDKILQDGMEFLERIASQAFKDKQHHAARASVMDQQKLIGNLKPDLLIVGSMDAPAEEQLRLAEALKEKALEARKRAGN